MEASRRGDVKSVERLLELGANIEHCDDTGNSLHTHRWPIVFKYIRFFHVTFRVQNPHTINTERYITLNHIERRKETDRQTGKGKA